MTPPERAMLRVAAVPWFDQSARGLQEWLPSSPRRRTLFDLSPMLHCSVIGTCLTMAELRKVLKKVAGGDAERLSITTSTPRACASRPSRGRRSS